MCIIVFFNCPHFWRLHCMFYFDLWWRLINHLAFTRFSQTGNTNTFPLAIRSNNISIITFPQLGKRMWLHYLEAIVYLLTIHINIHSCKDMYIMKPKQVRDVWLLVLFNIRTLSFVWTCILSCGVENVDPSGALELTLVFCGFPVTHSFMLGVYVVLCTSLVAFVPF